MSLNSLQNIYWIDDVESTNSMSQEIGPVMLCHSMSLVSHLPRIVHHHWMAVSPWCLEWWTAHWAHHQLRGRVVNRRCGCPHGCLTTPSVYIVSVLKQLFLAASPTMVALLSNLSHKFSALNSHEDDDRITEEEIELDLEDEQATVLDLVHEDLDAGNCEFMQTWKKSIFCHQKG